MIFGSTKNVFIDRSIMNSNKIKVKILLILLFVWNCKSNDTKSLKLEKWSEFQGVMNWDKAKKQCGSLAMRLPTKIELLEALKGGELESWKRNGNFYWTSTEKEADSSKAYAVFIIKDVPPTVILPKWYIGGYVRCIHF